MASEVTARANVLVLLTDQQTASALSCAGNLDVSTPSMDALASRGVRFDRAYCAQPLCSPSRASMWTGRMPTEIGMTGNGQNLRPEDNAAQLGVLFTQAGYETGYFGKWHLPHAADAASGFVTREAPWGPDEKVASSAAHWIGSRKRTSPFLAVVSLNEPHGICEWARSQDPPSGPVTPATAAQLPELPTNYARGAYEAEVPYLARERLVHTHPTQGWDETRWRQYRYAYYRLVERADAQIGRVLEALEASGQTEQTVVVLSSDHGDGIAAHQWNQKWILTEESVRVPLVVAAAGGPAGRVDTSLVSTGLDLLPTLCDYAGIEPPDGLRGCSLRPAVEGEGSPSGLSAREQVAAETTWEAPGMHRSGGRMIVTERYKYVCYGWGRNREQLFDLPDDPGEMHNLAYADRHLNTLAEHRRRLREHCTQTGDRFGRNIPT